MRYYPVNEIELLYNIENVRTYTRTMWYKIAEGYEVIPDNYLDYNLFIDKLKAPILLDWKLSIFRDGSLSVSRTIENGTISVQVNKFGKESFMIMPVSE